jgi:hypothetical protein
MFPPVADAITLRLRTVTTVQRLQLPPFRASTSCPGS